MNRKTERKWEIEEAARTLVKAEEIKANKLLFSSVKKEMEKQQKAVQRALSSNKRKK